MHKNISKLKKYTHLLNNSENLILLIIYTCI